MENIKVQSSKLKAQSQKIKIKHFTLCSLLSALCFFLLACGTPYGIYHRVRPGENLFRICKTYGVNLQEVAELNNITDSSQIKSGQKIFIPGANDQLTVIIPEASPEREKEEKIEVSSIPRKEKEIEKPDKIKLQKDMFEWPVRGSITSPFGVRGGKNHDGIDIGAKEGTPIKAAAAGKVIFSSDEIRSYGNLIIVKHEGRFSTVYAHNRKNLVKEGELVEKGQVIAEVGDTGRASAAHLHFEVRDGKKPRNPVFFLP
jgi:lipoprotein NlpD